MTRLANIIDDLSMSIETEQKIASLETDLAEKLQELDSIDPCHFNRFTLIKKDIEALRDKIKTLECLLGLDIKLNNENTLFM